MILPMICRAAAFVLLLVLPVVGAALELAPLERLTLDNPRAALRTGEAMLARAESPSQRIEVLDLMGRAAIQLGDSAALAEVLLRLAGEPAPAAAVAKVLRADRGVDLSQREDALRLALEAAAGLADASPLLRFHAQAVLCVAYYENRRYPDAERQCLLAETTARTSGNLFQLARAEDFRSWATYARGDVAGAIAISERALQRARALGADGLFAVIASNLAQAYVDVGRIVEALALSRESLRLSLAEGRAAHAVEARVNLARALQAQGRSELALAEIARALEQARQAQYRAGLEEVYQAQGRIAEQAGRADLALAAARGLADVRLRPADRPSADQLAELESRYRSREQALRIRALEQARHSDRLRLAEVQLQRARDRAAIQAVALAGAAALVLAVLLGWALRTQRRLGAQLQQLAERDPLTGIENRRIFMQRVQRLLDATSAPVPAALMILDLDHFKSINDRFGHPFGDTVLLATVAAVREVLDDGCRFARLGGEEFGLLCERHDPRAAAALAERLRAAVAAMRLSGPRGEVSLSVSVGVAPLLAGIDQPSAWFRAADAALYRAKHAGRNRVEVAVAVPA